MRSSDLRQRFQMRERACFAKKPRREFLTREAVFGARGFGKQHGAKDKRLKEKTRVDFHSVAHSEFEFSDQFLDGQAVVRGDAFEDA